MEEQFNNSTNNSTIKRSSEETYGFSNYANELWNADPNCKHEFKYQWSGITCKKCGGWFCF